ncbi:MAG: lipoyl(octanoyl) transferase LipB [Proteobacteria bacterium]|jgi:lipoyl(octanoyl) transferase|nr:lipoyl(octanoyl) transferase LipB [Candidatus Fonsibacter sp. PEL4]NBZ97214.1 lipoyl(octanoyl) transferase LipB [Candidatus Fonsibacter sp. PEL4]
MEIKISHQPIAYKKAIDFLEQRVEKVHAELEDELIWILEHDSVYTKGVSATDKDLLVPNLFPIIETNRGGKYTYHGPGQKIVYFVINLNKREKEIKTFVRNVEKWIISILKDFNISSYSDPKNIGIWIKNNNKENKIAAIGIKVKKWIAYHGFSLNINVNKTDYRGIVPCGISNKGIINISDLRAIPNDENINNSIKENFYKLFNS